MVSLPIFPLGTALMPGGNLPLQIFEPRYLQLFAELTDKPVDQRRFGVIALRCGIEVGPEAAVELHDVGCVALVTRIRTISGTRRLLVETRGTRRFHIEHLDPTAHTPYLCADIEWLPEQPGACAAELDVLAEALAGALTAYRHALGAPALVLTGTPAECSYAVADAMVLDTADRQHLRAAPMTADLLHLARSLMRR